jgi:voltage-gated potassium channel
MPAGSDSSAASQRRSLLREIIFGTESPAGQAFDVALLLLIAASLLAVSLESVAAIRADYGAVLRVAEWIFTAIFTVEYLVRLYCALRPARYARSFFGLVDLMAILPTYLSLLVPGAHSLLVIRGMRLLRIFRVFKLARFLGEADVLLAALRGSRNKLVIFVGTVLTVVVIMGALMYLVEGAENGFTSIPRSMYWAVVTMTTVGYGDIAPHTVLGQLIASVLMIIGYGIIAVPTGIVSAELVQTGSRVVGGRRCPVCAASNHTTDAQYCKYCGGLL